MKTTKQFKISLIILGLFLIFIPTFCHANTAIGGLLILSEPVFFLLIFFGIWAIESLIIKNRLNGTVKKALAVSFLVNSLSTIIGFFFFYLIDFFYLNNLFDFSVGDIISTIPGIIFLFISTVIIEGILLYFFYPQNGIRKLFSATFLMNIASYAFLGIILLITSLPGLADISYLSTITYFVIIFFLIYKIFKLFPSTKPNLIAKYLITILLIISFLFVLYIEYNEIKMRPGKNTASTIMSIRPGISMCCDEKTNTLQAIEGNDLCNPTISVLLPTAAQLGVSKVEYLIKNQCNSTDPGYAIRLTGHSDPDCNFNLKTNTGEWIITETSLTRPEGCK